MAWAVVWTSIPSPLILCKVFKTFGLGPDLICKVFIVKTLFFGSP